MMSLNLLSGRCSSIETTPLKWHVSSDTFSALTSDSREESPRTLEDRRVSPPPSYELSADPSTTVNSKVDFSWSTESFVLVENVAAPLEREASPSPVQPYTLEPSSIVSIDDSPIKTEAKDVISQVITEPPTPDPVSTSGARPSHRLHSKDLLSSAGAKIPARRRGLTESAKPLSWIDHSEKPKPADLPNPPPVPSENSYTSSGKGSPNKPAGPRPGAP